MTAVGRIADIVRHVRRQRGWSQAELARRAGTRQSAISAYETGRREPNPSTLERILNAAGYELRIDAEPTSSDDKALERVLARRERIRVALQPFGIHEVRVFGSVARGDDRPRSDLDLLVDLPARTSYFRLAAVARAVRELVDMEVHVVPLEGLSAERAAEVRSRSIAL